MRFLLCILLFVQGCKTVENKNADVSFFGATRVVERLISEARLNPSVIGRKFGVELEFSIASSFKPDKSLPFLKNFLIAKGVVQPANPKFYQVEKPYESFERLDAICDLREKFLNCVVDVANEELLVLRHSMAGDINSATLYLPAKEVLAKEFKIKDGKFDHKKTNALVYRLHHPLQNQKNVYSAELRCVYLNHLDILKCGNSFQYGIDSIEKADQLLASVFEGKSQTIYKAKGPYVAGELGELVLQLDGSAGYEIATQPLSYSKLESVQNLVDKLSDLGAFGEKEKPFYSTKLYGLHVNIDFKPEEMQQLPQVFSNWYKVSSEVKRYFKPGFVRTFGYARRPSAATIKSISALQGKSASEIKKELIDTFVKEEKLKKEQELNLLPYLEKAAHNRPALEFRVFDGSFNRKPGYGAFADLPYFTQAVLFAGQFTSWAVQEARE